MKFMLMMHAPRGDGSYQISTWKPALPYFAAAAEKTASTPERNYLLLKIARLRAS